ALLVATVFATLGTSAAPTPAASGIVVETVEPGYEAAKAGVQAGDKLLSWERPANPPANPQAAAGSFRSPFDVFEVETEQAPRAKTTTVVLTRAGRRLSVPILQYPWRVETRPSFSPRLLARYEQGQRLIDSDDLKGGSEIWRALAGHLSAASQHVEAAWLWSRIGWKQFEAKQPDSAIASMEQAIAEARAGGRPEIEAGLRITEWDVLMRADRPKDAVEPARKALAIREEIAPGSLAIAHCLARISLTMEGYDPEYERINRRGLRIRQ